MAGLLDWADPCVDAQKKFNSTAEAARTRADQVIQEWENRTEPTEEMRSLYVEALKEAAFKEWLNAPEMKPLFEMLRAEKPDFNARKIFDEKVYPEAFPPDREADLVRQLFKRDYENHIKPEMLRSRQELEQQLNDGRAELDQACNPTLVGQLFRGTVGNLLIAAGNAWAAGQREPGEVAKWIRVTSGVSVGDIAKYGVQGGENSVVNQVLGGDKSVLRETIRVLDPSKWDLGLNKDTYRVELGGIKIDLPKW